MARNHITRRVSPSASLRQERTKLPLVRAAILTLSGFLIIMTPRPGRIRNMIKVDLPYPRDRVGEAFVAMRRQIM